MKSIFYKFKFLLFILLGLTLILILNLVKPRVGLTSTPLHLEAQHLTQQGHQQLNLGQAEMALETWKKANQLYTKLSDHEGIIGSQINQSLALQALGNNYQACLILLPALEIKNNNQICQRGGEETEDFSQLQGTMIQGIALQNLGDILRKLGKLDLSHITLEKSLKIAESFNNNQQVNRILLSLANTEQAQYQQKYDLYKRTELSQNLKNAIAQAETALKHYQQVATQAENSLPVKANLNQLNLRLELKAALSKFVNEDNLNIQKIINQNQEQISTISEAFIKDLSIFSNFSAIQEIYAQLKLAQIFSQLETQEYFDTAWNITASALEKANEIDNKRSQSYALGLLGKLSQQKNQPLDAQRLTQSGLSLARSIQAWDIVYQFDYQLGQIYETQGQVEKALSFYQDSLEILKKVRPNVLVSELDTQLSFLEKIKPIYESYIYLQLQTPTPETLQNVTQVISEFQQVELENFLQCNTLEKQSLDRTVPVIYMLVLETKNRVAIIVQGTKTLEYQLYITEWDKVKIAINKLQDTLQQGEFKNSDSQNWLDANTLQLYQLLIQPLEQFLPPQGTLVLVLDSLLQGIPFSILKDEQNHYLIEKYTLAFNLGFLLKTSPPLFKQTPKSLLIGLTQANQDFKPLKNVKYEIEKIKSKVISSQVLLDQDFTRKNLTSQFNQSHFSGLHIATHGDFSSDPNQTFILAYDDKIYLKELDQLLRNRNEQNFTPIELMVLSACQTAAGDRRASLGLAGVAIQAGAETVVASLWNVSDRSTALLMGLFYQNLSNPNLTKAEALHQAQIELLNNKKYKDFNYPYYWGAFILVGNRL
ncbi:putative Tetratricopeptide domain protein [Planktothrix sp. PCC 11201]|uniref:CHAT domain-containing protein n=1 Tax=Planktothrix sp. PCC 11201 TaxID=1729650 RepID=UPI0009197411|nr:CHAT domain-containing protein [Planktothrix sp. PCC 11201]SKB11920.1 putative Tetratricopeptide domain protein [Planktothrix sp. PCC 11201]